MQLIQMHYKKPQSLLILWIALGLPQSVSLLKRYYRLH